jgi:integrase/recombinase XerD
MVSDAQLGEILAEFKQLRKDASESNSDGSGKRYETEIAQLNENWKGPKTMKDPTEGMEEPLWCGECNNGPFDGVKGVRSHAGRMHESPDVEYLHSDPGKDSEQDSPEEFQYRRFPTWRKWLREERGKSLWEANQGDVSRHIREMSRTDYSESSVNVRLSAISKFYQDCETMREEDSVEVPEMNGLDSDTESQNPAEGIKREDFGISSPTTKKSEGLGEDDIPSLKPDEINDLCDHVPKPKIRNELIIRLIYNTGIRRMECATILMDNVSIQDRKITVDNMKGEGDRTLRLPSKKQELQDLLTVWMYDKRNGVAGSQSSPYLFPTNRSEHISGQSVNDMVKKSAEYANIQDVIGHYADGRPIHRVTCHSLRHSYGRQAVGDVPIRAIQDNMNHKQIETTEIYTELDDDTRLRESDNFDPGT